MNVLVVIPLLLSRTSFGVPIRFQAEGAPFHVLRIAAGPGGTESNGSFVFTERRSAMYVLLSRTGGNGRDLDAAGAMLDGGRVLTAVKVLDETATLVAWCPGASRQELTRLIDLHRQSGWAALESPQPGEGVPPCATASPKIGDRWPASGAAGAGSSR